MIDYLSLEVPDIITYWGLTAYHWEKIKDVFKVETNQGTKNLKISPLNPQRLIFVHNAVDHLKRQNFTRMYPLIPTLDGRTYVYKYDKAFSLYDWVNGRQCDFKNLSELAFSTKVLADFHLKSTGFPPPPHSNMRDQLGKCLNHFEERYRDLLKFQKQAGSMPNDAFAQIYLENVDCFLPMAEKAIANLKKSNYTRLVQLAKTNGRFCHGDPAARNFILTPEGLIYLIDFDSCRLDLPIMDVIKFSRRVMKKYNWDYQIAKLIFDSYQEVIPLSPAEIDVCKAIFYFPQKFWRLSIRYFHNHQRYSQERSVHKFQKYLSNKDNLAEFQALFENYYC